MPRLRIALAQINTTVGDFEGNAAKIISALKDAKNLGADLVTFPELTVCSYPPEDLLLKPHFIKDDRASLERIATQTRGITAVIGCVGASGKTIYNTAALLSDGRIVDEYHKVLLPNYGVFDEKRYFTEGERCPIFTIHGVGVGVTICEDMWVAGGPAALMAQNGAELIVNISASPYHYGKQAQREQMFGARARECGVPVVFNNLVGGQDELVFDGNSLVLDAGGEVMARGAQFAEDMVLVDIEVAKREPAKTPVAETGCLCRTEVITVSEAAPADGKPELPARAETHSDFPGEVYDALVLGTRDYVIKNGFSGVLIGLSGGIDSALVAAVAADALGPPAVTGVAMPSRYSSDESLNDAKALAANLGIRFTTLPFEPIFQSYLDVMAAEFSGAPPDVTEENLQARIRGNLLMALSNKFGSLVLTTGNKSEMATGYCTLYGDMAGGFAVIKDVPKTMVYPLCHYRNQVAGKEIIPQAIINKPPSAELRPNQADTDSLPPYEVLDPVLTAYVEMNQSQAEITAGGVPAEVTAQAARLVDTSEYKRRQSPPGVKITPHAFGRDRRLPITNRYRGG
jgi:NAD+ synthase (glutamine-hydrolysing)